MVVIYYTRCTFGNDWAVKAETPLIYSMSKCSTSKIANLKKKSSIFRLKYGDQHPKSFSIICSIRVATSGLCFTIHSRFWAPKENLPSNETLINQLRSPLVEKEKENCRRWKLSVFLLKELKWNFLILIQSFNRQLIEQFKFILIHRDTYLPRTRF